MLGLRSSRRLFLFGLFASLTGQKAFSEDTVGNLPASEVKELTPVDLALHCTIKLICEKASGESSVGTGFIFSLFSTDNFNIPVIVTNKHVVVGSKTGKMRFSRKSPTGEVDLNNTLSLTIENFESRWIFHPSTDVDLCVMPIAPLINEFAQKNQLPFLVLIDQSSVPTDAELAELIAVEDVLVAGYPDGIEDLAHNIPVFRRGITATPPYIDFNNMKEFLIDSSIFPGSSGSPVFLYNSGSWLTRSGRSIFGGVRIKLLGIVHAVATHTSTGELKIIPAPTQTRAILTSQMPNNLGLCIKASRIFDFEPVLVQRGIKVPDGYQMRSP